MSQITQFSEEVRRVGLFINFLPPFTCLTIQTKQTKNGLLFLAWYYENPMVVVASLSTSTKWSTRVSPLYCGALKMYSCLKPLALRQGFQSGQCFVNSSSFWFICGWCFACFHWLVHCERSCWRPCLLRNQRVPIPKETFSIQWAATLW